MAEPAPDSDAILAALFLRPDGRSFHWMIMLPGAGAGGKGSAKRLHAMWTDREGWFFETRDHNLQESRSLCTIVKIGSRRTSDTRTFTTTEVSDLLKAIDMETPGFELAMGIRFDCRVWFRQAVRVLIQHGMVWCDRINDLEAELLRLATAKAEGRRDARIYNVSTNCNWFEKRFPPPPI